MNWHFHPILDSYAVVVAAAVLMSVVLLTPAYAELNRRRRLALLALRVSVIAIIVLLMLRPTMVTTSSQPQSRLLLVLFDRSRSMQLPDADGGGSRWERQQALLEQVRPLLKDPGEATEIKLFAFDKELLPVTVGQWEAMAPEGEQTDLGGASDRALRQQQGRRLAGVALLSDGVQTAYGTGVDIHRAARELGRNGVPLLAVPLGPAGDATQSRDVAVENLPEQLSGFVGNDLPVTGVVRVQGYVNQPLDVELTVENPQGESRSLGVTRVAAREDGQQLPVRLVFTPAAVGDYKLTLKVAEQDGEMVTANNSLPCYVRVREGLRVAYLYGTRLGEQQTLRWSLSGGNAVQLVTRFIDPRSRESWPQDHSDLLTAPEIDAVLLESVPAAAFRAEDLQALAEQVSAGKGLMMIGGYYSFGPGGYQDSPLATVLPVEMGRFERQDLGVDAMLSDDLHWSPAEGVQMLPVGYHPMLRLAPAERNRQVWERLPPLTGVNKLEPAKLAQVLAVAQNGQPLLIARQQGQGRVLAFAGDSTGRWWRRGLKEEHKRFWRQAVMWLVGREDAQKNEVWISLDRRRVNPGERIAFRAGARDDSNQDVEGAEFTAELQLPGGDRRSVPLRDQQLEVAGDTGDLEEAGDYVLRVRATKAGAVLGEAEASFQVIDRDIELSTAAADHEQLARLARLTEDAGGKLLAPEQFAAALQQLLDKPAAVEVDSQTSWELASRPGDAWALLLLLTLLLSGEWALRKRWGLV